MDLSNYKKNNMEKILVSFYSDHYYGDLEGLFITTQDELHATYGKEIYFGEVLGKHSEVIDEMSDDYFEVISKDQELIEKLIAAFGGETLSGYNPVKLLKE